MSALLTVESEHGTAPHELQVLRPASPDWLTHLADEYRTLRTFADVDVDSLDLSRVSVLDADALKSRLVQSSIADRRGGPFDVLRSDIAELALLLHVQEDYGCSFGVVSIRDRELTALPGRGIDLVGVEVGEGWPGDAEGDGSEPKLLLMLGEAKTSADSSSPPAVVEPGDSSLRGQHLANFLDVEATANKVTRAAMRCTDPTVAVAMHTAAECLRLGRFDILEVAATSMMVRPQSCGAPTDFGTFASAPEDFAPANVRFLILKLDEEDIEGLVDRFRSLALGLDVEEGETS